MSKQTIPQLNSAAFIRSLIADMRKTAAHPSMVLDMQFFAEQSIDGCHVCAGGSAVIHGMGAAHDDCEWTEEQELVARWCDCVRTACWRYRAHKGYPVPEPVQEAWSQGMVDVGPQFFGAWERFAAAWEAYEAKAPDQVADAMLTVLSK